jgi:hypothetical protein
MQKRISLSTCLGHIHRPRYEHFLVSADSTTWIFGQYNSAYFAVYLIPHMHYNTFTADVDVYVDVDVSHFSNKGTRYLCSDKLSEN